MLDLQPEPEPEPQPEPEAEPEAEAEPEPVVVVAARELLRGGASCGAVVGVLRCLPEPDAAEARRIFAAAAASVAGEVGTGLGWLRVSGWITWRSCCRRRNEDDAASVGTARCFWEELARPLLLEPGAGACFAAQLAVAAGLRGALGAAQDVRALMEAECLVGLDVARRPHGLAGSNIRRATGACLLAVELARAGSHEFRRSALVGSLALLTLPRRNDFEQADWDSAVQHMGSADEFAACKGGRHNDAPRWWHGDASDEGPTAAVHIIVARMLLPELLECCALGSRCSAVGLWAALQPLMRPTLGEFACDGCTDFAWAVLCRFHAVLLPASGLQRVKYNAGGDFDARDEPLLWSLLRNALQSQSKLTRARSFFVLRVALSDQDDSGWGTFIQLYDSLEHYPLQLLDTATGPGLWKDGLNAVLSPSPKLQSLDCKPRAADWTPVLCELGLRHPNAQIQRMVMESCLNGAAFGEDTASASDQFILDSILPRVTGSRASVSAAQTSRPVVGLSEGEGPILVPVVKVASHSLAGFLDLQLSRRTGPARTLFFNKVLLHLQQLPESANTEGQLQLFHFLACISPDVGRGLLRDESVKPLGHCVERLCRAQPDATARSQLRRLAVAAVAATVSPPSTQALARLLACFPGEWIMDAGLDAATTLSNVGSSEAQLKRAVADCIDLITGYQAKPSEEVAIETSLVVGFISIATVSTGKMQPLNDALARLVETLGESEQQPEYAVRLFTSVLAAEWCCSVTRAAFSTKMCNSRRLCESLANTCWHNISAGCSDPRARDCLRFLHTVGRFCDIPALQTVSSRLAAHCLEARADSGSAILPILQVCVDGKLETPMVSALLRYTIDLPVQISCGVSKQHGAEYVFLRWHCILKLSLRDELETSFWTPMLAYDVLEQVPVVLSSLHDDSQDVICETFALMRHLVSVVVAQNQDSNCRLWEIVHNAFVMFRSISQKGLALLDAATKLFLHPVFRDMVVINNHSDETVSWFDQLHANLCELGQTNPRLMAIVSVQFVRMWLRKPDASTASHIIDLCCYSCESSSASGCTDLIQFDDAELSLDKMIPERIAFSAIHSPAAVRGIAHFALAQVSRNVNLQHADWSCVGFKLLEVLLAKLKCADSSYTTGTYNDDSDIFFRYIALWQSFCLLVSIVDSDSPTALVHELHCSAAHSCLRPHALRVRQYIDCFLIRLLIAVPSLVTVWLPVALGDYSHQPQVASSLLVVALNVLMLLKPSERQMYFKSLFWKMNAWCGYSSRKNHLHSIAVVSTFRMLQAAEAAENDSSDVTECVDGWPRVSRDKQLLHLSMYAKTDPETVSDLLKLNPVFDGFDLNHLCSYTYEQSVLVFEGPENGDNTGATRGAQSFYDSIRSAFESGRAVSAQYAGDGAQTSVKPVAQRQSSQHTASAWSGGAFGDGIMYEQSLDDALQMVLPADSMRIDSQEVELISRMYEESTIAHVNDDSGASALVPNQVSTSIEHLKMSEDCRSARPLPLLVCASDVQDARTAGALARVSEVLGSSGLFVQEAAIAKSGSFVATSVGAGMWLPTLTVATEALGAWLERQRASGYTIVAIEPCSAAPQCGQHKSNPLCQSLVDYKFSPRTVLVLGDAKLGHSASTLGLVDVVVHVDPSPICATRGTIGRGSLQPHISGAIAIWSYMRSQLVAKGQSNLPTRTPSTV